MLIPTRAPAGPKSVAECFSNRVTVCPHRCESWSWVSRGLSSLGEQPFLGSVLRRLSCLSDPIQPCMFCMMKIPIVTGCSYFQCTTYTTCILGFADIANFAWHQPVQILASIYRPVWLTFCSMCDTRWRAKRQPQRVRLVPVTLSVEVPQAGRHSPWWLLAAENTVA